MSTSNEAGQRVALVTGAGRPNGLGSAIVRDLTAAGVRVVATDLVNEVEIPELGRAIAGSNAPRGEYVGGDISTDDGCAAIVEQVHSACGRLDILVNNAAAPHGGDRQSIDLVDADSFDRVINIGLRAPFLLMKYAVPMMRERHWGRLINVSSADAYTARPRRGAYIASKAGLIALTRSVAIEVGQEGITANCVCPGPMLTRRAQTTAESRVKLGFATSTDQVLGEIAARIPVGRYGQPNDVSAVVAFLASEQASYITAAEWVVDGGERHNGYFEV